MIKKLFLLILVFNSSQSSVFDSLPIKAMRLYYQFKKIFNSKNTENTYNASFDMSSINKSNQTYLEGEQQINSKLWQSIWNKNIDAIKELIDKGADINSTTEGYWTPLFAAISIENLEMVKFLIEHGAEVHYEMPRFRNNALFIASEHQNKEIIQLLLEKGLDINKQDKHGATPLFWAINWVQYQKDHIDIVRFLISKGADVNVKDNDGDSVLSIVCQLAYINPLPERIELIKIFLEAGADTSIKSSWDNKTIFDYANDNDAILGALEEHLAKKYHFIDMNHS